MSSRNWLKASCTRLRIRRRRFVLSTTRYISVSRRERYSPGRLLTAAAKSATSLGNSSVDEVEVRWLMQSLQVAKSCEVNAPAVPVVRQLVAESRCNWCQSQDLRS